MRILGINAGNGVIVYPLRKHLIANFEPRSVFRTKGDDQWKANFGDIPLFTKLSDFDDISNKDYTNKVDCIVSAPDCGHSSLLSYSRKKSLSDPKENPSFNLFMHSVLKCKPKVFIMENLPKILDTYSKEEFESTFDDYKLIFHSRSMSDFGNSQKNRIRLVIIGIRRVYGTKKLSLIQYHFNDIYKVNKLQTNRELVKGLKEEDLNLGNIREDIDDIITMYSGFKISLRKIKRFWLDNPDLKRWPAINRKFTTAPAVYINRPDDYPAVARKANRQYNHHGLQLTPRELAKIQGCPDSFKIVTPEHTSYWLNKARCTVTKSPPMELSKWFYKQLKKSPLWI